MNLRCKDGDLTVIIGDFPRCEVNIGRIVEVWGPMEIPSQYPLPCWRFKPIDDREWLVAEGYWSLTREVVAWRSGITHPDCWLLPIQTPDEYVTCGDTAPKYKAAEERMFL